jgi:hypothetical protein
MLECFLPFCDRDIGDHVQFFWNVGIFPSKLSDEVPDLQCILVQRAAVSRRFFWEHGVF